MAAPAAPQPPRAYGGKDNVMVVAAQFVAEYYEKFTSSFQVCPSMYGKTGRILVSGPASPGVPKTYESQSEIISHFESLEQFFGKNRKVCIRSVDAVIGTLGFVVVLVEGAVYTPEADTEFASTFILGPNDLTAQNTTEFHIASEALRFIRVTKNNATPAVAAAASSTTVPATATPQAAVRTAPRQAPAPVQKKVFEETEEEVARKATPPPAPEAAIKEKRARKERKPREESAAPAEEKEAAAPVAKPAAPAKVEKKEEPKEKEPKKEKPAKEAAAAPAATKDEAAPREKKERAPREKKEKPAKKEEVKKEEPEVVEEPKVDRKKNPWGNPTPALTTAAATAATAAAAKEAKKTTVSSSSSNKQAATSSNTVVLRNVPKGSTKEDGEYYSKPFGKIKRVDFLGQNHIIVEFRYAEDAKALIEYEYDGKFTMHHKPVRVEYFVPREARNNNTNTRGVENKERKPRAAPKKDDAKPSEPKQGESATVGEKPVPTKKGGKDKADRVAEEFESATHEKQGHEKKGTKTEVKPKSVRAN